MTALLQKVAYLLFGVTVAVVLQVVDSKVNRRIRQKDDVDRDLLVYGEDNRLQEDDERVTNAMRALGRATVMLVPSNALDERLSSEFQYSTFGETINDQWGRGGWCEPLLYPEDVALGVCSGILIADQYIATAGHCMTDESTCAKTNVVFNATSTNINTSNRIPADSVFHCDSIHTAVHQPLFNSYTEVDAVREHLKANGLRYGYGQVDFAVFKLDRPVPSTIATPATTRTRSRVEVGEEIVLIGHPQGVSRKYATAQANYVAELLPTGGYAWSAPIDAFAGNSGSGVFSLVTNELVGILVYGGFDYDFDALSSCYEYAECPEIAPGQTNMDDTELVNTILQIESDVDFLIAYSRAFGAAHVDQCGSEWNEGSTVLSAVLVDIHGCDDDIECQYGGTCNVDTRQCECLAGYFGADCSQPKSRALCHGIGENVDYMTCTCPEFTSPPFCGACEATFVDTDVDGFCYDTPFLPHSDYIDDDSLSAFAAATCECDASCETCQHYAFATVEGSAADIVDDDDDRFFRPGDDDDYWLSVPESNLCLSCKTGGIFIPTDTDGTGRCEYTASTTVSTGRSVSSDTSRCSPLTPEVDWCGESRCFTGWQSTTHAASCAATLSAVQDCDAYESQFPATIPPLIFANDDFFFDDDTDDVYQDESLVYHVNFSYCGDNDSSEMLSLFSCPNAAAATTTTTATAPITAPTTRMPTFPSFASNPTTTPQSAPVVSTFGTPFPTSNYAGTTQGVGLADFSTDVPSAFISDVVTQQPVTVSVQAGAPTQTFKNDEVLTTTTSNDEDDTNNVDVPGPFDVVSGGASIARRNYFVQGIIALILFIR